MHNLPMTSADPDGDPTNARQNRQDAGASASSAAGGSPDTVTKLARGGAISFVGIVFNAIAGFGTFILIGRSLSVANAGSVFEVIALFTVITAFAVFGADTGLLRFTPMYRDAHPQHLKQLFVVALLPATAVSALAAGVLFWFAPQLSHALEASSGLHTVSFQTELRVVIPFLPIAVASTVAIAGTRCYSIKLSSGVQYFFIPTARLALFAIIGAVSKNPSLLSLAWVLPYLVAFVVTLGYLVGQSRKARAGRHGGAAVGWRATSTLFWRFSAPRSVSQTFQILLSWLDVLLVGALATANAAAIYTVAGRYATVGIFALSAVLFVIPPQFGALIHSKDFRELGHLYQTSTWWVMLLSWPLLISLLVFPSAAMGIFGEHYRVGAVALVIISVTMIINTATGCNGTLVNMLGGGTVNVVATGVTLFVNVSLNLLLIPHLNETGAATAWLAAAIANGLILALYLWIKNRIHPFGNEYWTIAVSVAVCYVGIEGTCRLAFGGSLAVAICSAVASTAALAIALYVLRARVSLAPLLAIARRAGTA